MATFAEVSNSPGFQKTYLEAAKYVRGLATSDVPIRVLDVGGYDGAFGRALIGALGPKFYYVNMDLNPEALKKSPERRVEEDSTFMFQALKSEAPFDVVAFLNYSPNLPFGKLLRDFYFPKDGNYMDPELHRFIKPRKYENLLRQHRGIDFTSASLLLRDGGILLFSGVLRDEDIEGLKKDHIGYDQLPLTLENIVQSNIGWEAASSTVSLDTGGTFEVLPAVDLTSGSVPIVYGVEGKNREDLIMHYAENHKLLVFRRGPLDRERAIGWLNFILENHKLTIGNYLNPHLDDMDDF